MKNIADQLPPEIARQIHPDRRKNETAYWVARDQLLDPYRDHWIGFADGKVVASGSKSRYRVSRSRGNGSAPFFHLRGAGRRTVPHPPRHVSVRHELSW